MREAIEFCRSISEKGASGLPTAEIASALGYSNIRTNTFSASLSAARQFGLLTVTSRRSVTLALTLTDRKGAKLVDEQLFSENERENEGMGVMHSTNVDKLFNHVFKKVVGDVLAKLQPQLGGSAVRVSVNGVPVAEMTVPLLAAN